MNKSIPLLLGTVLLLLSQSLFAQSPRLNLELNAGAAVGWWVHDKGFADTLPHLHRGFDRTHLAFVFPVDLSVNLQHQRWELGVGAGYRELQDNQMIASDHRRGARNIYYIAERNTDILFLQLFGQARYELLQFPRFHLAAALKLGGFWAKHKHPQSASFRQHWVREIGLMARFRLSSSLECCVMPRYANQLITVHSSSPSEQHNIYSIGVLTGLRFSLTK